MKPWEINADNLSKAGWSLGLVSAIDSEGRQFGSWTHIETTEFAIHPGQTGANLKTQPKLSHENHHHLSNNS
jgi:hypothetical protein